MPNLTHLELFKEPMGYRQPKIYKTPNSVGSNFRIPRLLVSKDPVKELGINSDRVNKFLYTYIFYGNREYQRWSTEPRALYDKEFFLNQEAIRFLNPEIRGFFDRFFQKRETRRDKRKKSTTNPRYFGIDKVPTS